MTRPTFTRNLAWAAGLWWFSNAACHLVLQRIYRYYADYCSAPDFHEAANTPLGAAIIVVFQVPALVFWFSRERNLRGVAVAIASMSLTALIWYWWVTPPCQ